MNSVAYLVPLQAMEGKFEIAGIVLNQQDFNWCFTHKMLFSLALITQAFGQQTYSAWLAPQARVK
jgi:hypothetical protein